MKSKGKEICFISIIVSAISIEAVEIDTGSKKGQIILTKEIRGILCKPLFLISRCGNLTL
jgi:hypothetical protein